MKIINVLQDEERNHPHGTAVLMDEYRKQIRLWVLNTEFYDGRTYNTLKYWFRGYEIKKIGLRLICLGKFNSVSEAIEKLVDAKLNSRSNKIQGLYIYHTEESKNTLTQFERK